MKNKDGILNKGTMGGKNHSQEEITTYTLIDKADLLCYAFKKGKLNGNPEYR